MKGHPTQQRLKELFNYREDGELIRKTSISQTNIGDVAGSINKSTGYREISVNNKLYLAHRLNWIFKYGYNPESGIDHIDRIRSNNPIENLREATQSCNLRNTGNRINNTSGVKGVYWSASINKWYSKIWVMGKSKHLFYHNDFNEAVLYRLAAEQCLDWDGCDSSSPAYKYALDNKLILNNKR